MCFTLFFVMLTCYQIIRVIDHGKYLIVGNSSIQ